MSRDMCPSTIFQRLALTASTNVRWFFFFFFTIPRTSLFVFLPIQHNSNEDFFFFSIGITFMHHIHMSQTLCAYVLTSLFLMLGCIVFEVNGLFSRKIYGRTYDPNRGGHDNIREIQRNTVGCNKFNLGFIDNGK